jgi:hypothetical protein
MVSLSLSAKIRVEIDIWFEPSALFKLDSAMNVFENET